MRLSSGIAAALLCRLPASASAASSVRLPYEQTADGRAAGIPPPPGTYVPVPTFFSTNATMTPPPPSPEGSDVTTSSYPLDLATQAAYSVYLAEAGIAGLAIFGSTGEPIHVTTAERNRVISATRKALDDAGFPDYPLIAGVVSQQLEESIEQLRQAKRAGAQWGVCLVPGYFAIATSQQGIIDWFTAIADKSPIPILIYDYPVVTNNIKVAASTYEALAKHPNIVGAKIATLDVPLHSEVSANPNIDYTHFHPYTGLGQQMLAAVTLGAFGAFDVISTAFPRSMVRLYELSALEQPTREQRKEARELQWKVSTMGEFYNSWYVSSPFPPRTSWRRDNVVGIKEAIYRVRGFGDRNGVRLPLRNTITDEQWEAYGDIVKIMMETEDSL